MLHLDDIVLAERARLAGMISYIIGFDPEFMNTLVRKYGHLPGDPRAGW